MPTRTDGRLDITSLQGRATRLANSLTRNIPVYPRPRSRQGHLPIKITDAWPSNFRIWTHLNRSSVKVTTSWETKKIKHTKISKLVSHIYKHTIKKHLGRRNVTIRHWLNMDRVQSRRFAATSFFLAVVATYSLSFCGYFSAAVISPDSSSYVSRSVLR